MHKNYTITAQNILNFFYARIPNTDEIIIHSYTKAALDLLFGRVIDSFGTNPTAAAVFRDSLKAFTNFKLIGVESGSTGIKHDYAGFYGAFIKVACKGTILTSYITAGKVMADQIAFPTLARALNYICEIAPRYLNIASREKQLSEKKDPDAPKEEYLSYLVTKSQLKWWPEAFSGAIAKTATSDLVGEYIIKPLGYQQWIRHHTTEIESNVFSYIAPIKNFAFMAHDDIYAKSYKIVEIFNIKSLAELSASTAIVTCVIATDAIVNFCKEITNGYIFISSTKTIQDAVGLATRYFSHSEFLHNVTKTPSYDYDNFTSFENITLAGEVPDL